jgi:uncharacterized repeat protein (TIGR03803 family)
MKHYYLTALLFLCLCLAKVAPAQGIYQLWGVTPAGGNDDNGTIFSTRFDGTGHRVRHHFSFVNPGIFPDYFQQPVLYNGKLYGMLPSGSLGSPVIFVFDPVSAQYQRAAVLADIGGKGCQGSLTLFNNKLYGVCSEENNIDGGFIFEFDPANNQLVKKVSLTNTLNAKAVSNVVVINSKFYGLTENGGTNDRGMLYEYDPAAGTVVNRYSFTAPSQIEQSFLTTFNNRIISVIPNGGSAGAGLLFEYNPATQVFTNRKEFTQADEYTPSGPLSFYNGLLYGVTQRGGEENRGVIFDYNPATFVYTKRVSITAAIGAKIFSGLTLVNDRFYGCSSDGGIDFTGMLFEYNPAGNVLTTKMQFDMSAGWNPLGGMIYHNDRLYGLTNRGGQYSQGTLFEYNPATNSYEKKVDLGGIFAGDPSGNLTRVNNKLFGVAAEGGANGRGIIYEYDLLTKAFTTRYSFSFATGYYSTNLFSFRGMTLFGNKLYGVTSHGGGEDRGVLYEFDPQTGVYTPKVDLSSAGVARFTWGPLCIFNNKLYGVAARSNDGGGGVLFEYDPATNAYSEKVIFSGALGDQPYGGLTVYNNRLYGTTRLGGAFGHGTLFEYNPAVNGIVKRHDFNGDDGSENLAALTVYNNKLYGSTRFGGTDQTGVIYEYDPATFVLTKKVDLGGDKGRTSFAPLTLMENKLYGFTRVFGPAPEHRGVMFEYDPATNGFINRVNFSGLNGAVPGSVKADPVPAPTAEGLPGSCIAATTAVINTTNANKWVAFTNTTGEAVAEINANGNVLGTVSITYYVHDGPVRKDGSNNPYLDRNIAIRSQFAPSSPVTVRLYIRRTEFETLKNTPGSGIVGVGDLAVFKNSDNCSPVLNAPATQIPSSAETWANDYVYTVSIPSFSSFYFGVRTLTTLPVRLLSFEGEKQTTSNKLTWKATCTGNVDFVVQRSTGGISFSDIGMVMAFAQDCDNPFGFEDAAPAQRSYYRLKMKEQNGEFTYSSVILLDRTASITRDVRISPNPASGDAVIRITSDRAGVFTYQLVDMAGRVLQTGKRQIQPGITLQSLQSGQLPAGVYQVVYMLNEEKGAVRLLRQ